MSLSHTCHSHCHPQGTRGVREFNLPSPTARLMLEPQAPQGSTASAAPVLGWALTCQQLRALLHKRLLLARRSHRGLFAQVMVTVLGVWGAMGEGAG